MITDETQSDEPEKPKTQIEEVSTEPSSPEPPSESEVAVKPNAPVASEADNEASDESTVVEDEETDKKEEEPFIMPDLAACAAQLGLPEPEVRGFIHQAVEDFKATAQKLKEVIAAHDRNALRREALMLKGVADNLGLETVSQSCEALVKAEGEEAESIVTSLEHYFARLADSLEPDQPADAPEKTAEESTGTQVSEPENEAEASTFDPKMAAAALGLPESMIMGFVRDFIRQYEKEKPAFEEALQHGDMETIRRAAHKLNGVAANLYIEEVQEFLEKLQKASDTNEVAGVLPEIHRRLSALSAKIDKEPST
jgi:HPt (histidine-containing phosphotransfer) domain-containing protein